MPASVATTITVDAASVITRIPPSEFGHNANIWMTAMVTEPVFLKHVGNLQPHIIRFPAGSGSDCYFWNRWYGSLPSDVPAELPDSKGKKKAPGYMYGRSLDRRTASLDNYYTMLKMTGNEARLKRSRQLRVCPVWYQCRPCGHRCASGRGLGTV